MIAYRAETAMIPLLRDARTDPSGARTILQNLFRAVAVIVPDVQHKRLHVYLHRSSRPASDRRLRRLLGELNATETTYPGTDMLMHYELVAEPAAGAIVVSEQVPRGKDV